MGKGDTIFFCRNLYILNFGKISKRGNDGIKMQMREIVGDTYEKDGKGSYD